MNHFTVELVSNASQDRFADNSTTSFTSYLAQPIKLEGKWKFALTKISVPTHFNNVSKSRIRIKPNAFLWYSKGWDRYVICDIEVFFGTAQDVIEKINECVREALKADWDRSIAEAKKKAVENMTWEESIEKAKERNAGNVEVDEEPPVDLDQDFLHSVEINFDGNLRFKLDDNFMTRGAGSKEPTLAASMLLSHLVLEFQKGSRRNLLLDSYRSYTELTAKKTRLKSDAKVRGWARCASVS